MGLKQERHMDEAKIETPRKLITDARATVRNLDLWDKVDRDLAKAFDKLAEAVELLLPEKTNG